MFTDRIALGSGAIYITECADNVIPEDTTIEVETNRLGDIQGGATVEYSQTTYTAKDDLGRRSKIITTEETVKLKTGVMTWNGNTLKRLCSTARVTEESGKRTVKIGGAGNADGKIYVIRFVHKDKVDGDCRVTIIGKNSSGLSLSFARDKETVINAEFEALPNDSDGTLLIYTEQIVGDTP